MKPARRWVVDTNTLISRLLLPGSVLAKAVDRALDQGDLLVCAETLRELADVLERPKFNRYLSPEERRQFFGLLSRVAVLIKIIRPVQVCRDPADDKFLAVAVNGEADAVISGDADLLAHHPYMGIPILRPKDFLEWVDESA